MREQALKKCRHVVGKLDTIPCTHFKLRMSLILVLLPHLFRKSPLLLGGSYRKSRESRSSLHSYKTTKGWLHLPLQVSISQWVVLILPLS